MDHAFKQTVDYLEHVGVAEGAYDGMCLYTEAYIHIIEKCSLIPRTMGIFSWFMLHKPL